MSMSSNDQTPPAFVGPVERPRPRYCPACGAVARECCDSIIGDVHQTRCPEFGTMAMVRAARVERDAA